jgi:hypothetical protein
MSKADPDSLMPASTATPCFQCNYCILTAAASSSYSLLFLVVSCRRTARRSWCCSASAALPINAHLHCICFTYSSAGEIGKSSLGMFQADPDSLKVELLDWFMLNFTALDNITVELHDNQCSPSLYLHRFKLCR